MVVGQQYPQLVHPAASSLAAVLTAEPRGTWWLLRCTSVMHVIEAAASPERGFQSTTRKAYLPTTRPIATSVTRPPTFDNGRPAHSAFKFRERRRLLWAVALAQAVVSARLGTATLPSTARRGRSAP